MKSAVNLMGFSLLLLLFGVVVVVVDGVVLLLYSYDEGVLFWFVKLPEIKILILIYF